ncbi:MAG: polysaccharide biosynthesis/export family protein [Desulfobacterales bacterium]|nr:MAG: polysaccharide biosynthesis/export family protein [Desulfobacterales bacterium]
MKKTFYIFSIGLAGVILLSLQLYAAEKKGSEAAQTWSAKASKSAYLIGAGDILEIITWKEPDFTRAEVLVRIDGKISFPLLDDIQAAGLTTLELKRIIEKGLKDYVETPVVTVHVRDPVSQKFYILGEVTRTGEYPLVKNLTVLQAFALAGGFTEWASKKEIILLRNEGGQNRIYRINYKNIVKGDDFDQNLNLRADDTIIVP